MNISNKERPLIILTGPTSVGKTELSINLAKLTDGEIISADSMQVYKRMNIGTAKITKDEMCGVKHYLIDVIEPSENYNAAQFCNMAETCINEIYNKGKIPIIVGGTGFYIQAVLYGIDFTDGDEDNEYRKKLSSLYENGKAEDVYNQLKLIDPIAAEKIHPNDQKRVIRALEFYKTSGKKISEHNYEESKRISSYNYVYFVLNDYRELIYDRINQRVDEMIQKGLLTEVKNLLSEGCTIDYQSMKGIGYKEILGYLNHEYNFEYAVNLIKQNSRHYAKRQITWFKREKEVTWINKFDYDYDNERIIKYMIDCINSKL